MTKPKNLFRKERPTGAGGGGGGGRKKKKKNQSSIRTSSEWQTTHDNSRDARHRDIGQLPRHPAQHAETHVKTTDSRANGIFPRRRHKLG